MSRLLFAIFIMISLYSDAYSLQEASSIDLNDQEVFLKENVSYLEDVNGILVIDQVLSRQSNFISLKENPISSYSDATFWFKIDIKAKEQVDSQWLLAVKSRFIQETELFAVRSNGAISIPFNPGLLRSLYPVYPIEVSEEKATYFLKVKYGYHASSNISLIPVDKWSHEVVSELIVIMLCFGACIGLMLYNITLFVTMKEKVFLYYILFVSTLLIFTIPSGAYSLYFLKELHWSKYIVLTADISLFFSAIFAREYLKIPQFAPKIDKLLKFNMANFLVLGIASLVEHKYVPLISDLNFLIYLALMVYAVYVAVEANYSPAKYYVIGITCIIGAGSMWFAASLGIIPSSGFVNGSVNIGLALEMVFLSLGLAERVESVRKEYVAKMEEVNHDLELKVEVRAQIIKAQQVKMSAAANLAALGEMAGGIAHEINNPLAIIKGFVDIIKNQVDANAVETESLKKATSKISMSVERISRIIKSMRAISRQGEGDPMVEVKAETVIADVLELCTAKFRNSEIDLQLEFPQGRDVSILCRPVQISQVLVNLLNNAYDAIQGEKDKKWIRIEVTQGQKGIQIAVSNSGPKIPDSVKERIFVPFFTTKEVGKGTGLGLSLSRGIMESHGGTLTLDDSCANTRFALSFPDSKGQKQVA